jgi:predicted metal-dependent hydrolase
VTLPTRASHRSGMALLMSHVDWVADRLAALPDAVPFTDGAMVPICGVPHRIRHVPTARGGAWLLDDELHVTGAPEFLRRRAVDFLRAVAPKRIVVKDTSSRWGSCAPDKTLAFSWRLVMAPEWVQDYVAAHEVAHIGHMHHGPLFWAQVERLTPHTKAAIAWLRRNGARLQRMG